MDDAISHKALPVAEGSIDGLVRRVPGRLEHDMVQLGVPDMSRGPATAGEGQTVGTRGRCSFELNFLELVQEYVVVGCLYCACIVRVCHVYRKVSPIYLTVLTTNKTLGCVVCRATQATPRLARR